MARDVLDRMLHIARDHGSGLAVTDRDHKVLADEDHDLTGFDDLAGQHHRFVRDVIDGLQHQEHRVVVALELGPLVCAHRVLDRQRVQPEHGLFASDSDV